MSDDGKDRIGGATFTLPQDTAKLHQWVKGPTADAFDHKRPSMIDRLFAGDDVVGWTPQYEEGATELEEAREYKEASEQAAAEAAEELLETEFEGEEVGVQTAGDDRVCDECQDIADDGPYTLDEAEGLIPAHNGCRCAYFPWADRRYARDFNPEQARAPAGTPEGGQWIGETTFVSPNVGNLTFEQAKRELNGPRQHALDMASDFINDRLGIHGIDHHVLGAWADGPRTA